MARKKSRQMRVSPEFETNMKKIQYQLQNELKREVKMPEVTRMVELKKKRRYL